MATTRVTDRSRRAAERLGQPDLAPLVDELVRRFSSGADVVRITVPELTLAGRARLADHLGADRLPAPGSTITIERLAAALGLDDGPGVRAVVVELRGPLDDRRAARADRAAARADLWDDVERRATGLAMFGDAVAASAWVGRLRATGVPDGNVEAHRNRLGLALAVLERLPADPAVSLASLAADVTGSAHGLDPGRRLTRAVLEAIALSCELTSPTDAEAARSVWERAGVVPDPLSSTVLVLGLRPAGADPLSTYLRAAASDAEPVTLTLRQLQRWDPGPSLLPADASVAHVFENPALLAEVAGSWSGPPLVCSSGRPTLAVVTLIRRLVGAGVVVHQHADFDPAGVEITRWLAERAHTVPWRMTAENYRAALATGRPTPDLQGSVGPTPWDPALAATMTAEGRAIHEESLRHDLLDAISAR